MDATKLEEPLPTYVDSLAYGSARPPTRRRRVYAAVLTLVVVVAIGLGVGLGLGLMHGGNTRTGSRIGGALPMASWTPSTLPTLGATAFLSPMLAMTDGISTSSIAVSAAAATQAV